MTQKIIGYTAGVFDLFHIGHLNLLKHAKSMCDVLIVSPTTDEYCYRIKGKYPIFTYEERSTILESIRYVDLVVPQDIPTAEQFLPRMLEIQKQYGFHKVFKGIDMKGTPRWIALENEFSKIGVEVVFCDTVTTSSTSIRQKLFEY